MNTVRLLVVGAVGLAASAAAADPVINVHAGGGALLLQLPAAPPAFVLVSDATLPSVAPGERMVAAAFSGGLSVSFGPVALVFDGAILTGGRTETVGLTFAGPAALLTNGIFIDPDGIVQGLTQSGLVAMQSEVRLGEDGLAGFAMFGTVGGVSGMSGCRLTSPFTLCTDPLTVIQPVGEIGVGFAATVGPNGAHAILVGNIPDDAVTITYATQLSGWSFTPTIRARIESGSGAYLAPYAGLALERLAREMSTTTAIRLVGVDFELNPIEAGADFTLRETLVTSGIGAAVGFTAGVPVSDRFTLEIGGRYMPLRTSAGYSGQEVNSLHVTGLEVLNVATPIYTTSAEAWGHVFGAEAGLQFALSERAVFDLGLEFEWRSNVAAIIRGPTDGTAVVSDTAQAGQNAGAPGVMPSIGFVTAQSLGLHAGLTLVLGR